VSPAIKPPGRRPPQKAFSDRQRAVAASSAQGAFWAFVSKYSGKAVNLVTVAVLARLLTQDDFGVAAYALVVIAFLEVTGLGIGPALVYHDADDRGKSTGFWLAGLTGFVLYGLAWASAPLVGDYFNDDRAIDVVRVLALSFPIMGLGAVPEALLLKSLSFKKAFLPGVAMSVVKAVTAIILASLGFGAWALIHAQIAGAAAQLILFWVMLDDPWRPRLSFDRAFARKLGGYGSNIAGIEILGAWLLNVDYLLVGRYLGAAALGVYVIAFRIPELLIKELYGVLSRSLFPIYTKMKDDHRALGTAFTRTNQYVGAVTIPMAVGLWLVAEPVVVLAFGVTWTDAIPVIGPIALYTVLRSLYFNAGSIYKSTGRPGLLTKLNIGTALILTPALYFAAVRYESIAAVAWTHVAVTAVVGVVQLVIASRVIGFRLASLGRALWAPVAASAIMAGAVTAAMQWVGGGYLTQLATGVGVGVIVYGSILTMLQRTLFHEARQIIRAGMGRS
jgi:O-antigen/teichoic acid export membrane protein